MRVYISPTPENAPDNNGIGRIVHAQFKYLPRMGIQLVKDPRKAEVFASHISQRELPRVDVLHSHGLYFEDLPHSEYMGWNYEVNRHIADSARRAKVITVPSAWVAYPFQRDMHVKPLIIPHAIEPDAWKRDENGGYVLWNKTRADDVCDPSPAIELARRGIQVMTTFLPLRNDKPTPQNLTVTGPMAFEKMKAVIQRADIYLATTPETFGIGTLEAMAAGVPVLAYDWAGTSDLIQHKVTGYLVVPGDIDGLAEGYRWLKEHYKPIAEAAHDLASTYTWERIMPLYVNAYRQAHATPRESGTSIIITAYNYAKYLPEAVESALRAAPDEIIVVDDGSTDNTPEVILPYLDRVRYLRQANQGVAAARNHGIEAARHDFVTCLDADDRLAPGFVKTLSKALDSDTGLGIAYSGLAMIQNDGKATHYGAWPPVFDWRVQSQASVPPGNCIPSGCMFRKSMWKRAGGYYQEFAPGEDAEFWTRALSLGFTAKKITDEGLFEYRTHDGSASRTKKYKPIDTWLPWMRSGEYPFAAPQKEVRVWSRMAPWVTVIIPVGPGHERLLLDAVRSVEGQSYRDWQLVVVADTDIPRDVLDRMPFAEVIQGRRKGAGAARNDGMKLVKGKFVVFLDADDYLHPSALEKMLKFYNGKGYVYADWWRVDENGIKEVSHADFDDGSHKLQHAVTTLLPTYWARQLEWDETLPAWEDVDYYLQARKKGFCGIHLAEPLLYYRVNTGERRKLAERQEKELNAEIMKRYKGGHMTCGSCPSPNAGPIMEVKRMTNPGKYAAQAAQAPIVADNNGIVRLEFIGMRTGSRSYNGSGGRIYKAGNNTTNRFINVDQVDAPKLLSTGDFKIVVREPVPMPVPEVVQASEMVIAPEPAKVTEPVKMSEPVKAKPAPEPVKVQSPVDPEYPPMPEGMKDLKAAIKKGVSGEVLMVWEQAERVNGKRKIYLQVLRDALKTAA